MSAARKEPRSYGWRTAFRRSMRWLIMATLLALVGIRTDHGCAATKTASNGNWNTAGTWSPSGIPTAADSVYIPSGANLTLDANGICGAINIVGGLSISATASRTLTISTSSGLSGNFYNTGTINGFGSASGQVFYVAGNFSVTGGTLIPSNDAKIVMNGTGTKTFQHNNTLKTLEVNGSNLTVQLLANATIQSDLTITSGTLDLGSYTANRQSTGGTITVAAGASLKIGGTNTFPSNYSTTTLSATSTVEYSGSSQTVTNVSYGHLTLSGSGTKTMPGTALTIAGNLTTSGTVTATAAAAMNVNGNITIGSGSTVGGSSYTITLLGNFSNSGTFTASLSTIAFSGTAAQTINGSATTTFYSVTLANTSASISAHASFNVNGTLTVNANATLIPDASVVVGGTGTLTGNGTVYVTRTAATPDFSTQYSVALKTLTNLTVTYSASTAQTISAVNYGNLIINGTRTTSNVTFASVGTIGIAGAFTLSATFTSGSYVTTGSTIDYNGTGAQTVVPFSYNNLTISGARGTNNVTLSSSGTITIAGNATSTALFSTGAIVSTNSTVDYNGGGAQTVMPIPYCNLTYSNAGVKLLALGTTNISGALTLSGSASGDFLTNATTLAFIGSSAQSINGTCTFYNLTINNPGGVTLNANCTVNLALTLTSGNITTGANTLSLGPLGLVLRTSGHVVGNFRKPVVVGGPVLTFEIGAGSNYTPVAVTFANVTVAGNLIASTAAGDHASIRSSTISSGKSVNRTWTLTNSGITFTSYGATFTFVSGDVDAGANTSNFIVGKWSGGAWSYPTVGTKAATSTQITGVTSFSDYQIGEVSSLSGTVFEDVNYGGGAGRSKSTSSGAGIASATVELYNASGSYVSNTTTDANGDYSFTSLATGTYYVRVVVDNVQSSRPNWSSSCKPVMTYRTNASSGSAVAVTDYVGGTNPSATDPGAASSGAAFNTSTFVYTAGLSGTAQAITTCVLGASVISGIDFGFNFNTVVNTNNSGQGSLRQVITNMNTLNGDASLAQSGLTAGKDNAVFMISNGTSASGLRSSNNYFSGGIAAITPTSSLPTISTSMILDAQKQPGWSSAPVVEIIGTSAGAGTDGLTIDGAGSVTIRGFIIISFSGNGIHNRTGGNNVIQSNYIGINSGGTTAAANNVGMNIEAGSNTIGGTSSSQRNVVSGNSAQGIYLNGTSASANTVQGNYVGLNAAGTSAVANASDGIYIANAPSNTIGGTTAGAGNVISGNGSFGLHVYNTGATGTVIQGNYIGLNAAGTAAVPNGNDGVSLESCSGATVGGTTAAARNVLSGNTNAGNLADGLWISGGSGHTIQGNYIGLNAAGSSGLGNYHAGMTVEGSSNNTIGGTAAGAGNVIADNTGKGVIINGGTGNAILGNSFYGNTGIGIDLGDDGVTANNGTKSGSLPNYGMDFPVFTSAVLANTTLTIAGYVGSAANQSTFANARVEIFKSDGDASGYGEGQTYLGFLTADANGNISGTLTVSGLASGDKITGTATDASNNTSEFGANVGIMIYYYSKGSLAVNTSSNWNTSRDGSGIDASSFGTPSFWVIQNTHSMTLSGSATWDVGTSGTVEIESGGSWTNSSSGSVTIGTFTLDGGSSYVHSSANTLPGTTKTFASTSSVSYAGSTQTVAATTYGTLQVTAAGTKTLAGNATIAGDLSVQAGTLDVSSYTVNRSSAGGTLTVSNGATLKIGGLSTMPSNYSTHALGATSIVEYSGTNQIVSAETYGSLSTSGSGTKTAPAGITVTGDITIGSGTTFAAGSYTHAVQGNWSNNGTFTASSSTVELSGSSNATISGSTTFNELTLNKSTSSTTVTLNNATTTATLTMTQGTLVAGSSGITITSTRSGNGIITGMITRTHSFSVGSSYAFEGPYNTLTFTAGTPPTSVTVNVVLSSPGSNSSMSPITRYYDISQTGGSGFTYTLRLHYEDSEVSSPNSETSPPLKIWRRTSTGPDVWERKGATSSSTTNNWVEMTGITETGVWSLSSTTVPNVVLTMAQNQTNPSPGAQVTYTISYSNTGDGTAGSVIITATVPAHTTYVSGSVTVNGVSKTDASDADEVTVAGSTITINLGSVSAGASGTATYRVVIQ